MKKVLIPVHTGFEETELITTLDNLKRGEIEYFLWSIEGLGMVQSSNEALVTTDPIFPATEKFDAVFFPGGPAVKDLVDYDEILHIAKTYFEEGKFVAAICAAPEILLKAGILEGKKYTAYPEHAESPTKVEDDVVVDGKIITGKNFRVTQKFAETLVNEMNK